MSVRRRQHVAVVFVATPHAYIVLVTDVAFAIVVSFLLLRTKSVVNATPGDCFRSVVAATCQNEYANQHPVNTIIQRCQVQRPAMREIFQSSPPPPDFFSSSFRRPFEIAAQLYFYF